MNLSCHSWPHLDFSIFSISKSASPFLLLLSFPESNSSKWPRLREMAATKSRLDYLESIQVARAVTIAHLERHFVSTNDVRHCNVPFVSTVHKTNRPSCSDPESNSDNDSIGISGSSSRALVENEGGEVRGTWDEALGDIEARRQGSDTISFARLRLFFCSSLFTETRLQVLLMSYGNQSQSVAMVIHSY
ncbi:hypothetical protein C8J56DRAFT_113948 [Mycena floridula]|nr:hypothetical protein C8J56DRAFT_113948 [Mycena floridula]